MNTLLKKIWHICASLLICLLLASCTGSLIPTLISPALDNMSQQNDIELVCEGTPAYLLMIDSLIADDPSNTALLALGAKAYSGVIGALQECGVSPDRIAAYAEKGHQYGISLLSAKLPVQPADSIAELEDKLDSISKSTVSEIFWGVFSWIVWVEQQQGAPAAMADLGKIEKILLRIIEVDESVQNGASHFLLAGYYGSRPRMFGGDLEKSEFHFKRALDLSGRKMLIFQTVYAQTFARISNNKELHDALLHEVLNFAIKSSPENTLANLIAKRKAKRLLQEDFFLDQ